MNERTHFFIKIYLSHFILERVDVGCVWEMSWRRGQTATYWPKVLLTIAALLSHLGWGCLTVGYWGLQADSHAGILSPNWLQLQLELTQSVCSTRLYNCLRTPASVVPLLFKLMHLLIDGSVEGQYITGVYLIIYSFAIFISLFINSLQDSGLPKGRWNMKCNEPYTVTPVHDIFEKGLNLIFFIDPVAIQDLKRSVCPVILTKLEKKWWIHAFPMSIYMCVRVCVCVCVCIFHLKIVFFLNAFRSF